MEALSEFDAELAASVRGALHVTSRDYRAQLACEACPPEMSRRAFVRWKVQQLLVADVAWQFAALSQVGLALVPDKRFAASQQPPRASHTLQSCLRTCMHAAADAHLCLR